MKLRLVCASVCVAALFVFCTPRAIADLEVSAGISINATADFYDPLSPYGEWVTVGSYGRCWRPASVEVDWRPYSAGHWEWTDAGWFWVSDEPWGWACYHYGSWVEDPNYGWVWVPATEWAPAWVVWRSGGGYIGWAPCAPPSVVVAPTYFVFVGQDRFTEPCTPRTVIINNVNVINKTTVLNVNVHREQININGERRAVFYNQGPGVNAIEKAVNRHLTEVSVRQAYQHEVKEYNQAVSAVREGTNRQREKNAVQKEQNQDNRLQNQRQEQKQLQQDYHQMNDQRLQDRNQIDQQYHQQQQDQLQNDRKRIEQQNQDFLQQQEQNRQKLLNDERNRLQNDEQRSRELPNRTVPPVDQNNPRVYPNERQVPPVQTVPPDERTYPGGKPQVPPQGYPPQRDFHAPNQPGQPAQPQSPDKYQGMDKRRDQGGPPQ